MTWHIMRHVEGLESEPAASSQNGERRMTETGTHVQGPEWGLATAVLELPRVGLSVLLVSHDQGECPSLRNTAVTGLTV